jgi:hypothetical protein
VVTGRPDRRITEVDQSPRSPEGMMGHEAPRAFEGGLDNAMRKPDSPENRIEEADPERDLERIDTPADIGISAALIGGLPSDQCGLSGTGITSISRDISLWPYNVRDRHRDKLACVCCSSGDGEITFTSARDRANASRFDRR